MDKIVRYKGRWVVDKTAVPFQVVPEEQRSIHTDSLDCLCEPIAESIGGSFVIVHNAFVIDRSDGETVEH